jgi:hypothetical protein
MPTSHSTELYPKSQRTDQRLSTIASWLETIPSDWRDYSVDSITLFEELERVSESTFPSVGAMGSWIDQNSRLLAEELNIIVKPVRSARARSWMFQRMSDSGAIEVQKEVTPFTAYSSSALLSMSETPNERWWLDAID